MCWSGVCLKLCAARGVAHYLQFVIDDQPVQVIAPALPLTMPVFDFSQLETRSGQDRVQQLIHEEAARPFDLAMGH